MCCIFTYFSWTIDFIQRIWTFLMSCCIGGALCVLFIVASMSGIAFGYNYSMSEFMTLKSSQVNLTYERDFDNGFDVIDMSRQGDRNKGNQIIDDNVVYKAEINVNDDRVPTPTAEVEGLDEVIKKYGSDSVAQMKAVQNHINLNKLKKYLRKTTRESITIKTIETSTGEYISLFPDYDERELSNWRRVEQNERNVYSPKSFSPEILSIVPKNQGDNLVYLKSLRKGSNKRVKNSGQMKTTYDTVAITERTKPERSQPSINMTKLIYPIITTKPFLPTRTVPPKNDSDIEQILQQI